MNEAWFFVGLFVFIFVIWIAVGGPAHGIPLQAPTLPAISVGLPSSNASSTKSSFFSSLPKAPFTIGTSYIRLPDSSSGGSLFGSGSGSSVPGPLAGVPYGTPSIYKGIVTMSHGVSGAGSSNPDNEYVTLYESSQARVPVDLSGWTLESEATGAASIIPKGTQVPHSGIVNAVQDIILTPGERAYVISGRSPIGASFKENTCIGYFAQFQQFSPSLPLNCPTPSSEFEAHYPGSYIRDASCIDYVNSVPRCQAVLSPPATLSGACQSFLVTYLNYNGCVTAHENDANFDGSTWHIYLGRTTALFRTQHEVVKLLDDKGDTVDAFTY